MNNMYDRDVVFSKNIIEMLTVAHEYCLFIEDFEKINKEDAFLYLIKVLPLLYLKGTLLPIVELSDEDANERFVTEEAYISRYNIIKEKLGKHNLFMDSDSIDLEDAELVNFDLAELFSDIYQDLKDFVLLYQKESLAAKENAVYACRYLFGNRWGYKIIHALKALHNTSHL